MVNREVLESFPMKAEGSYSYNNNSSIQRYGVNRSKTIIEQAIAEKLDIKQISTANRPFTIADLGCASGPNTFVAVKNIVGAVELKYEQRPEFLVYFNDHVTNDFNTLFRSCIASNKQYFMSAAPGSFHGRLFPKASLHFVHCSFSLHWLSMVPNELLDQTSPAWNKGRITYGNAPNEVVMAYSKQFAKDMTSFLNARAEEVVRGGLMVLLLSYTAGEIRSSLHGFVGIMDLMGSCLLDMAKLGLLSEAGVDSFNLPIYLTTIKEVRELIKHNGHFSIENIEPLIRMVAPDAEILVTHLRAAMEGVFKEHFGNEIMDEFFKRLVKKVAASSILPVGNIVPGELCIILQRKFALRMLCSTQDVV
ncbi:Paraxanthine methyltransferase [Thalictrum thalictroides]|uniref:Paraxanthine methyltransferase n=1 Tax=Thalictrum thalictroides TaxID=46969 RepID=A0A7J6VS76_THATH|nr:Paraxanthine methyltransferase [Thalictrum thalictroides]